MRVAKSGGLGKEEYGMGLMGGLRVVLIFYIFYVFIVNFVCYYGFWA